MKRVAEIIYVVPERREEFLNGAINLDQKTAKVLWMCGVRNQQYYAMNELIFMTFEYNGNNFNEDMKKMAAYLDGQGKLVKCRRKDVPIEERATTDWWAPVRKLGTVLDKNPHVEESVDMDLMSMLDGAMISGEYYGNTAFDEEDWSEAFRF